MEEEKISEKCSVCGFDFDDGIYLMKNQHEHICIFCLKKKHNININDLIDQRQLRILTSVLDREGCVKFFADLL